MDELFLYLYLIRIGKKKKTFTWVTKLNGISVVFMIKNKNSKGERENEEIWHGNRKNKKRLEREANWRGAKF